MSQPITNADLERSSRIAAGVQTINQALENIEDEEDRAQALEIAIKLHKLDPTKEKPIP